MFLTNLLSPGGLNADGLMIEAPGNKMPGLKNPIYVLWLSIVLMAVGSYHYMTGKKSKSYTKRR